MTKTILIVEDDPAIASTLRYTLEREGWQVTWVDTAGQVLPTLQTITVLDAIVLDVGLPDGDGFSLCQKIRFGDDHARVPILFLTARNDEIDKVVGLEMGADDYITKPFSPREIVARLKAIWRRDAMHRQPITNPHSPTPPLNALADTSPSLLPVSVDIRKDLPHGRWHYQHRSYQLYWNNRPLSLSKTELAIMLTLLAQPTHILSREQILAQISDYPEHRLARTIDSHIKSLRQKLAEVDPTIEVIATHRGLGYSMAGCG